jgi:thiamine kinase-like enzyme
MAQGGHRTVDELSDTLERLQPPLGPLGGKPSELSGGITNRNYRVRFGDIDYVVRRPGKDTELLGIDRDAERLANEAAAALGVAPAVAAALEDCLVTLFVSCQSVSSAEVAGDVEQIALALRSFHESGVRLPSSFIVPALLDDYARIVRERGGVLPASYSEAVVVCELIVAALPLAEPRPCHNDLLAGNLIRAREDGRMLLVDWEYAAMGDPRFDLGNLSINNDFDDATDERLLSAYYEEPPSDARRAALKLMRVLSDAREAAWGVMQAEVSELDFDFAGYGREHFERLHAAATRPEFKDWLAAAEADAQAA